MQGAVHSGVVKSGKGGERNPAKPDLALHQSLPDLLRNPVEPDLALHQSLPDLLRRLGEGCVFDAAEHVIYLNDKDKN